MTSYLGTRYDGALWNVVPPCWEQGIGYTQCWSAFFSLFPFSNAWKTCVPSRMCLCQCLLCVCPGPIFECHWNLIGQRHLRGKGDVPADELLIATISPNNALLGWPCCLHVSPDSNEVVCFCEIAAFQPPPRCMAVLVWIFTHGVAAGQMHRTVKRQPGLYWPSKMSNLIMCVKKKKRKEQKKSSNYRMKKDRGDSECRITKK